MEQIDEGFAREEIIRVTRIVTAQGLVRSNDGNISIRLDEDHFLMTPSGVYKMTMEADDLIVIDWDCAIIKGRVGLKPTSETRMHLEVYRQREDICAVLHAHPIYATALTIAGLPFPMDIIPEAAIGLGSVPIADYATPGSKELAESIQGPIKQSKNIILSHHGTVTAGYTLEETLIALERIEHTAHSYFVARSFGEIVPLPELELVNLQIIGRKVRGED